MVQHPRRAIHPTSLFEPTLTVDTSERSARLLDDSVSLDRFFFRVGVEAISDSSSSSLESVDVSGVSTSEVSLFSGASSGDAVLEDPDDSLDDDELVDDESDPSGVSADATPCPVNTAAPIPRATASPPMGPTRTPAPMPIFLPWRLQRRRHLGGIDDDCVVRVNSTTQAASETIRR